ncbi:MAG: hypothetical protein RLZZ384_562, partial [Pseudomonadota bacterium]
MNYAIETQPIETLTSDVLCVGIYANQQLTPSAKILDDATQGLISSLITRGDIAGKLNDTLLLNVIPNSTIERILLVGLGEQKALSAKNYRKVLASAIAVLKKANVKSAAVSLAECDVDNADIIWKTRQIVEVFSDKLYQFTQCKSKVDEAIPLSDIIITALDAQRADAKAGLVQGLAIAEGMTLAKHLADLPANICTPSYLAKQALTLALSDESLEATILDTSEMEKLGMGALLAVARGSRQPPKLITLEYRGGDKNSKPIVLIGKGLTFDAGGISLKPGAGMDEMKYDMCGGAAVLGTMQAV